MLAIAGCSGADKPQVPAAQPVVLEVFHADSLAGPMGELKKSFEAKNPNLKINLTSGRSQELAERILKGDACDVFAPSDPVVIKEMFGKSINGKTVAAWSVVFSANEMVVITKKGNPLGIKQMSDLAKDGASLARVTGEKDMATNRTIQFITKAVTSEGKADLAQKIVDGAAVKAATIPDAVTAVKTGKAAAGIVYLSAAVAAGEDVQIISFPAAVNLSSDIRNAVTVPGTAKNQEGALKFVTFILATAGQEILKKTGQPPIVPPIKEGSVPAL